MSIYFSQTESQAAYIFPDKTEQSWLDKTQHALAQKASSLINQYTGSKMNAQHLASLKMKRVALTHIRGAVNPYWQICFAKKFRPLQPQSWLQMQLNRHIGATRPPIVLVQVGALYFVCDGFDYIAVARELEVTAVDALVTNLV